jgi:hypothetical protein
VRGEDGKAVRECRRRSECPSPDRLIVFTYDVFKDAVSCSACIAPSVEAISE